MFRLDQSYCQLPATLYRQVAPTPVREPQLLLFNQALADNLGLPALSSQQAAALFSGNQLPVESHPIAQAYAGHQFGHPTILGDGRAVLLGDWQTPAGERVDIQLKGAGRTPYSRGGDGRAALGPMLREYLISESLAALGVTTARSLAVVTTGESVLRGTLLPGALVTRVASSHLRVGTFQFAAWQQEPSLVSALLDYAIARHYPQLATADNPALAFLECVMERQIALVVDWMRVGFIHGVLNTDNVTISGEAIDFGPCAFMDDYSADTVFSSIDRMGRYAFGRQPVITQWNLARLAEALLPLISDRSEQAVAQASQLLDAFMPRFDRAWQQMMRGKLGLTDHQPDDDSLLHDWLTLLQQQHLDYTNSHRLLMDAVTMPLEQAGSLPAAAQPWYQRWRQRVGNDVGAAQALMAANNPCVIPRNHLVNKALEQAEQGSMAFFQELLTVLSCPYEAPANAVFCQPPSADERVTQTFCGT